MKHLVRLCDGGDPIQFPDGSGGKMTVQNDGPGTMILSFRCKVEIAPGKSVPIVGDIYDVVLDSEGDVSGTVIDGVHKVLARPVVRGTGRVINP